MKANPRPAPPPRPPQPGFDTTRMILWSVILVAVVGTLGYAAYTGGPETFGGFSVSMKVDANPAAIPTTGDQAGHVQLTVKIQNRTSKVQVLNARAPCKLFRWVLTDAEGRLVQAAGDQCDDLLMEMTLQPNESKTETVDVKLDPSRLKPGERYQFTMEYWSLRGLLVVKAE